MSATKSTLGKLAEAPTPPVVTAQVPQWGRRKVPTNGRRGLVMRLSTTQLRQLRAVAYDQERSIQSILMESVWRYLQSVGAPFDEE